MATRTFLLGLLLCACGEPQMPDGGGIDAGRDTDAGMSTLCEGAADGASCGGGRICLAGECLVSECGDSFVDTANDEECDDGNDVAFDGCDTDCTFTCEDDTECSDGDLCNGGETCTGDPRVCMSGTSFDDGTPCSTPTLVLGVCSDARCVPPGCGNGVVETSEQCDDGNTTPSDGCETDCTFTCEDDAECDDGSLCTGTEVCVDHVCTNGSTLPCDDGDACTADTCDAVLGCRSALIDADGDGYAPSTIAGCGTDCDDANTDRHPGAQELCTPLDEDCDGNGTPAMSPRWYVDCDSDGFAASGAMMSAPSCTEPAPSGCGGRWTTREPDGSAIDCDDASAGTNPLAMEAPGDAMDRDEDCDGAIACYVDGDSDGHRTSLVIGSADGDCGDPGEARISVPADDCRDNASNVYPGASEVAGDPANLDENCDGTVTCFADADADGYRTTTPIDSADADCADAGEAFASRPSPDCLDTDPTVRPGRIEECDGLDNDCNGTADPAGVCPPGCTVRTYGGHVYLFCAEIVGARGSARNRCQNELMLVVRIDDAAENEFVRSTAVMTGLTMPFWIGAEGEGGDDWRWEDGTFFWTDGALVPGFYANWAPGEPILEMVTLSPSDGLWRTDVSGGDHAYVCERY